MKQQGLMIDLGRCIGCKTCIVACRNWHELVDYTKAKNGNLPYYLRVANRWSGTYPHVALDNWVMPCQQCQDPQCAVACPEGAIHKDAQTGIVHVNQETCTGCNAEPGLNGGQKLKNSPCTVECPAHINVQGYVGLAAKGKYHEALRLIKQENPLPSVCGRVCHHPCEAVCKRAEIDEPVAINAIKRFVADLDLNAETRYVPQLKAKRQEKVAVIGSGPAGLTCAYFLAWEGYRVTILEKAPVLGGMLTTGIPAYRLPHDVVEAEIEVIRDMGVEMQTGVEFGTDLTVGHLREQGFKAFFFGIGAQQCTLLDIEGDELGGVYSGLDYLRQVNLGQPVTLGKRVAVIGGGNVAMDAVRTARRLGSDEAFIVYRRSLEEMPALPDEIAECQEEGIPIHFLTHPLRLVGQNGHVSAMECTKMMLTEPDETGRRRPEPVAGSEFTIAVDAVIGALGQEADWACLTPECACQLNEWGLMEIDPVTLQSADADIFAGGDAIRGSSTVIEAIADGKRAARAIDRYLRGLDLRDGLEREWAAVEEVQKVRYNPAPRVKARRLDLEARRSFEEVQEGLSAEMALQEAERCLSCGSACVQACPYIVIQFNEEVGKAHKCDLCSSRIYLGDEPVCVETCLTDAITFGELELLRQTALGESRQIVAELSEESILYVK